MNVIAPRTAAVRKPLTEARFCRWIGQAMPGDIFEYHRGFLALDIVPPGAEGAGPDRTELARVARRAWWASEHGLIDLVQRRHGTNDFSYFAIVRTKPRHAPVTLDSLQSVAAT